MRSAPVGVERQAGRAGVGEADVRDAGAGSHVELVLQRAGPLVQPQVDARPELAVDDVAVAREPVCHWLGRLPRR